MLSLKHFRSRGANCSENLLAAYGRMLSLFLDGVVIHAVRGDATDYARLAFDMTSLREDIARDNANPGDLLIATGSALKALQEYNRRTANYGNAQAFELQKIAAMLTGAVINLSAAGSANVATLQALERQLERAAGLDEVRLLKDRLSACLLGIREEKLRQQAAADAAMNDLTENRLSGETPKTPLAASVDAASGLRSRPGAELAVAEATDGLHTVYGVLFVIDHLHGLNTRYGRSVGDQLIVLFTQHLAQHLRPEDRVFRWSGPAFLALLERDEPLEKVRRSLSALTSARLEKNGGIAQPDGAAALEFLLDYLADRPWGESFDGCR